MNLEVARALREIADFFAVKGDRFRSRAYRRAAQRIESLTEDIREVHARGELRSIPGVGESIARVVEELITTGRCRLLEELRESMPGGIHELMKIEGIGPKTALLLHRKLGITTLEELETAVREGRLRTLRGFGPKVEENILKAIEIHRSAQRRFLLGQVLTTMEALERYMAGSEAVERVMIAGSARRRKETVGDLDLLVASERHLEVVERFVSLPEVVKVVSRGTTKSTVILRSGLQVDLRVVDPESFGSALQYFTGSKEHNIKLRRIAVRRGWKLNEYGLFDRRTGERIAGETEESIYRALGLDYIEPELREDRGEIEAAAEGRLPRLVRVEEVRGDLHMHTKWSDGTGTIGEMVEAARALGLEYIAICDHSKSMAIAHGLDEARLRKQMEEIERLNRELEGFTVLSGVEVDIKRDGSLDLRDKVLKDLDFVVASVHSGFKSSKEEMTNRIVTALHNDYVRALGHPTGRLILKRPPYSVDLERVFEVAREQGVLMEINAFPNRLDLNDVNSRAAKEAGLRMSIGTDAHTPDQLRLLPLGVYVARRAWLEPKDVVNTLPVKELLRTLER